MVVVILLFQNCPVVRVVLAIIATMMMMMMRSPCLCCFPQSRCSRRCGWWMVIVAGDATATATAIAFYSWWLVLSGRCKGGWHYPTAGWSIAIAKQQSKLILVRMMDATEKSISRPKCYWFRLVYQLSKFWKWRSIVNRERRTKNTTGTQSRIEHNVSINNININEPNHNHGRQQQWMDRIHRSNIRTYLLRQQV